MTDREKTLINLHKLFLKLHYKVSEYELAGVEPPDNLLKKFKDPATLMLIILYPVRLIAWSTGAAITSINYLLGKNRDDK